MPTYEYACKECGEHLEVQQAFSDAPLTECPSCKGPLRKVFGNIAIAFKGSGFYKTDSRSSGAKAKPKSDAAATPTPAGGSSDSGSSSGSSGGSSGSSGSSDSSGSSGSSGSGSPPAAPAPAAAS